MKIYVYYIGRAKDPHANALTKEFLGRAAHYNAVELREIRPDRVDLWGKHPSGRKFLLEQAELFEALHAPSQVVIRATCGSRFPR